MLRCQTCAAELFICKEHDQEFTMLSNSKSYLDKLARESDDIITKWCKVCSCSAKGQNSSAISDPPVDYFNLIK